jgi:hypothetical protein
MRILLVTGDQPIEQELMHLLEQSGHELTRHSAGGDDVLSRSGRSPHHLALSSRPRSRRAGGNV